MPLPDRPNLLLAALLVAILSGGVAVFLAKRPAPLVVAAAVISPASSIPPTVANPASPPAAPSSREPATDSTSRRSNEAASIDEAFQAVAAMPDDEQRSLFYQTLLRKGLELDPAATAGRALAMSDEKLRNLGVSFVLLHWGEKDPTAALGWALDHPPESGDSSRVFAAYEGFASRDPLAALRWLQHPGLAPDLDEFTRITIHHFNTQGRLAEARREIESLPAGELRDWLVQQTTRTWAAQSPFEAAQWLAANASDQGFITGMGALATTLAEQDPSLAAGLTQQFDDPRIRDSLLADVIYLWARRDLGAAAAWLRAQPADSRHDAAVARMAEITAPLDPVEAAAWLRRIQDPGRREQLRQQLKQRGINLPP